MVVLGFLFGTAAVRFVAQQWLPTPDLAGLGDAVAVVEHHDERTDVAFVGSSHVMRGVDPFVFDRTLRRHDVELFSVNLSAPGLRGPGQRYLLEQLEGRDPPRLRYVVVEPRWRLGVQPRNRNSERVLALYDLATTELAIDSLLAAGASLGDVKEVVRASGHRLLSVGRLARTLLPPPRAARWDIRRHRDPRATVVARRGYQPKRILRLGHRARRFENRLQRLDATDPQLLDETKVEIIAATLRKIRKLGAKPVILIPPSLRLRNLHYRATHEAHFEGTPLLAFNDPDRYPQLFRPELYQDSGEHLNRVGAEIFSKTLATRFLSEVLDRAPDT